MLTDSDKQKLHEILLSKMQENGIADDWRIGLCHVYRVWEYLEILFKKMPRIARNDSVSSILQIFVLMHDIEKGSSAPDHAVAAVEYLQELNLEIDGISEEDMEIIYFIIANHNKGLESLGIRRAKQKKHIMLGLAELVNHMDYLGLAGHYRVLDAANKESGIFGNISDEMIAKILDRSVELDEVRCLGFDEQDVALPRLIFDWCLADAIIGPIDHILTTSFRYVVFRIRLGSERRIREIIRLQQENKLIKDKFLKFLEASEC